MAIGFALGDPGPLSSSLHLHRKGGEGRGGEGRGVLSFLPLPLLSLHYRFCALLVRVFALGSSVRPTVCVRAGSVVRVAYMIPDSFYIILLLGRAKHLRSL